jgi:hypothetical protein
VSDPLRFFRQVWLADFEYTPVTGELPVPLCLVALELRTGRRLRLWLADCPPPQPPYGIGTDSLFVSYYAVAELSCHQALGWPPPARILDLCVEFKNRTCGLETPHGKNLLGALLYFGLSGISAVEKSEMQALAMRGGPYSADERSSLISYCEADVEALNQLLPAMLSAIDLPRALVRGTYMAALAKIEATGIPVDRETWQRLLRHWDQIASRLIAAVDKNYGIYLPDKKRYIKPETRLGAAIIQTAREWGIDQQRLADVLDYLWKRERDATTELTDGIRKARQATGLTISRIARWEDSGKDSASYPGLDVKARSLARELPALGIGKGYSHEDGYDDTDYAGNLWELLRQDRCHVRSKYDPPLLREAAETVAREGDLTRVLSEPIHWSNDRFAAYLARERIPWPQREGGGLALDKNTFRDMAKTHPTRIGPIRDLRHALSQLRLCDLEIGVSGRNRCSLWAFSSSTGRNQPSNSAYCQRALKTGHQLALQNRPL